MGTRGLMAKDSCSRGMNGNTWCPGAGSRHFHTYSCDKASHMARSDINKVEKYIPPTTRRAEGSKYLLNNLPQDPTLFFLDGHVY